MDRPSRVEAASLTHFHTVPGIYSAYIWKNVVLTFWFSGATLESCKPYEEGCRACAAEHPEGVSTINVMVPGSRNFPEPEARVELSRILRQYGKSAAAIAVVIPGTGFWTSAVRAVVAALTMVKPRELPMQVFGGPAELAVWLAPLHGERTGVRVEATELQAIYEQAEREACAREAA